MTNLQKFKGLHRMLEKSGVLRVNVRLYPNDGWDEYDVWRLWVEDDRIFYSTPSWSACSLLRSNEKHLRNAAYIYDQINYDRNLF